MAGVKEPDGGTVKPFSPIESKDPTGEFTRLNWDAVREQIAVITALYWFDREGFDKIVRLTDEPVTVHEWFIRNKADLEEDKESVSYVCFSQDDQLWIVAAGTETGLMWGNNLTGTFVRSRFPGEDGPLRGNDDRFVWTQSYFGSMGEWLYDEVEFTLASRPQITRVNVVGHSLGGAAAFICGCLLRRRFPDKEIHVLTFGEPQSFSRNLPFANQPQVHYRIVNGYDPITVMPPAENPIQLWMEGSSMDFMTKYHEYGHYGNPHYIASNGIQDRVYTPVDRLLGPTSFDWMEAFDHFSPSYVRSLAAGYKNYGGSPESGAALAIAAEIARGHDKPAELGLDSYEPFLDPPSVNRWLTGDPNGPVTPENFWRLESATIIPGAGYARGLPYGINFAVQRTKHVSNFKTTLQINQGAYGYSESYTLVNGGETPDTKNDHVQQLVARRVALLGQGADLVGIRVSDLAEGAKGVADFVAPLDDAYAKIAPTAEAGAPQHAITALVQSDGTQYNRVLTLRGFPKVWQGERYQNERPFTQQEAPVRAAFKAFLDLFRTPANAATYWGIPARPKLTPEQAKGVQAISVDVPTNRYIIHLNEGGHQIGEKIQIRGVRGPGTKGINGVWRVVAKNSTGDVVTINKTKCDLCQLLPDNLGTYNSLSTIYPAARFVSNIQFANRKTGRAFFTERGRQKGKCC
jgi:hypothetical protein